MARLIEIDDPADPRLADYRDLRDVQLRRALEAEHGLFLAEGEKVVRRAVEGGFEARSFLMAPRWLDGLADVLDASDAPCYVLSEALAERVTGFHVHRGALASLHRRPDPSLESVIEGARFVLVLEDLVDHTNVGAAFRSGAALGVDAVLLEKVVQKCLVMGALWRIQLAPRRDRRAPGRWANGDKARLAPARKVGKRSL